MSIASSLQTVYSMDKGCAMILKCLNRFSSGWRDSLSPQSVPTTVDCLSLCTHHFWLHKLLYTTTSGFPWYNRHHQSQLLVQLWMNPFSYSSSCVSFYKYSAMIARKYFKVVNNFSSLLPFKPATGSEVIGELHVLVITRWVFVRRCILLQLEWRDTFCEWCVINSSQLHAFRGNILVFYLHFIAYLHIITSFRL